VAPVANLRLSPNCKRKVSVILAGLWGAPPTKTIVGGLFSRPMVLVRKAVVSNSPRAWRTSAWRMSGLKRSMVMSRLCSRAVRIASRSDSSMSAGAWPTSPSGPACCAGRDSARTEVRRSNSPSQAHRPTAPAGPSTCLSRRCSTDFSHAMSKENRLPPTQLPRRTVRSNAILDTVRRRRQDQYHSYRPISERNLTLPQTPREEK